MSLTNAAAPAVAAVASTPDGAKPAPAAATPGEAVEQVGHGTPPGRANMPSILAKRRALLEQESGSPMIADLSRPPATREPETPPAAPAAEPAPAPAPEPPAPPAAPATAAEPPAEPTPAAAEPQPAPAAEPAAEPAPAQPTPGQEPLYRIRVNGRDLDLTAAELVRQAQRGVAADQKFQEAASLKKQADETLSRAQTIQETVRALNPSSASPPSGGTQPPAAGQPAPVPADLVDRAAEAFQFGDKDQVRQAVTSLVEHLSKGRAAEAGDSTPVDMSKLTAEVRQQVLTEVENRQALTAFAQHYSDVLEDPVLVTVAANYVNQLRAHDQEVGAVRPLGQLMFEAGKFARDWLDGKVKAKAPTPAAEPAPQPAPAAPTRTQQAAERLATKTERKAASHQPPAPAAARVPAPAAPAVPTNKDYLQQRQQNYLRITGQTPRPAA